MRRIVQTAFDATRAKVTRAQDLIGLRSNAPFERVANVDEETRTVELAFASDQSIEHWFGMLTLDMNQSAVVMDRVNNGVAPHLVNHDPNQHVGVVMAGTVSLGSTARAKIKFSESAYAQEIFRDIQQGIRSGVSFGFLVHEMELESEKNGIPSYRAAKWEILETSTASIPADISVGIGRSLSENNEDNTKMPNENGAEAQENKTPVTAPEADGRSALLQSNDQMLTLGRQFGNEQLAREFVLQGKSFDELRSALALEVGKATTPVPPKEPEVQLARSVARYSKLRNFAGADAEQRAHRFGMWLLGGPLGRNKARAYCQDHGIMIRTMQESVNEVGGYLVPEEFGNDMIDLRDQYGVFRRNAKIVPMTSDTRSDPRRTGGLTAYFVGESDEITASDKGWDRVSLIAKKLAVKSRYSSEVSEDAAINFGDDLAGEIAYAFAYKEDLCGFGGDGSSTYGGIVGVREKLKGLSGTIANIAGLVVGAGNLYSELTLADFKKVVGKLPQYADGARAKWFVHRSFYWDVMVGLKLAAGGVTAAEVEGTRAMSFLGYPVEFAQVMPKAEANSQVCALLGDLSLAARVGTRRDATIALSEHSRFSTDEIEIRGTERFDINVHDVGNADASASLQVPGPVVGLITAAS